MDAFFNTLKKGLVAMLFMVVGFAMTYVPQLPSSNVHTAQAGGVAGGATEVTQVANNVLLGAGNAINTITAGAVSSNWLKENVLDGIGWAIAKSIISGMVRSLINWVNSGFQGSPSFITDLKGFLLNIVDEEFGRIISELGAVGSFICSPFRLDVQISLETQYAQGRAGQTAPTCTLSGIVANIEGFITGIDPGAGFSDWLAITSTPKTYTPYGAVLNAEVTARARLINAKGETLTEVNWGDGFLSQKICESVGGTTGGQQCSITKPGRVIADQLNKALGAGQDSLVAADEINELISALLGQLANQALTGVAGLLGLSGGTGYSYSSPGYSGSYLDALAEDANNLATASTSDDGTAIGTMTSGLDRNIEVRDVLTSYRPALVSHLADTTISTSSREEVTAALQQVDDALVQAQENIGTTANLLHEYDSADYIRQTNILIEYSSLTQMSLTELNAQRIELETIASNNSITLPAVTNSSSLTAVMNSLNPPQTIDQTDAVWIQIAASLGMNI